MGKKEYILNLIQFINSNFENNDDLKTNVNNIKILINYINNNKREDEFHFSVAEILVTKCPPLVKTIKIVKSNSELNSIFSESENEKFKDLYNNLVGTIDALEQKDTKKNEKLLNDDSSYDTYSERGRSEDIYRNYTREIAKIPLLSPEEEKTLAYEIRNGNNEAREKFTRANLRLVVSVANRYRDKGLDILDLIQEGNLGLMKAVEKFDPDMGYKFSTYATYWIKLNISRAIANFGRTIRISVDSIEQITKINNVQRVYLNEHNRKATDQELSEILGLSLYRIKELKGLPEDAISLDSTIGEDKDATLMDYVSSDENFEEEIVRKLADEKFMKIFNKVNLSSKERKILLLRVGFYDDKIRTLEEIGKMFNVSRERIRQVEARALRKLRSNWEIKELADNNKIYLQDYSSKRNYKKVNYSTEYIEGTGINLQRIKK